MKRKTNMSKMIVVLGTFLMLFTGVAGAFAADGIPLMVRARHLAVLTDVDSDTIPAIGGEADVDNSVAVELDFTWFFTDNLAAELVLAIAQHNVEAKGVILPGTATPTDLDLGDVWLVPPILLLQYHIIPDGKIRPYVGAGVNYNIFFEPNEGTVATNTSYDNSVGYAVQAGMDICITDNFFLNIDVKKLWLDTEAEVSAVLPVVGPATVDVDVDIDPWLLGVGIGYRF